ncbi:Tetratricopeptide repeat-domain-containing protein [Jimgerdemannia flammicorona]|uniref:Tetratricopeptide repeat-domain-containing protein n=1 Tax=Jimgerdemannia flammicorona TaxID=994334 RepID=A0A433Q6B3_9FUNG|nr:Tetratricopeptide repeat-domain-containing protein [Jimgerdemannia flammicorona]
MPGLAQQGRTSRSLKGAGTRTSGYSKNSEHLAGNYKKQGKYNKAEPLYDSVLAIAEKVLSSKHSDIATTLNNLAGLYIQGSEKAELLYEQVLGIQNQIFRPEHPGTAATLKNLARIYSGQDKNEEAQLLYEQILMICEKVFGSEYPHTAQTAILFSGINRYISSPLNPLSLFTKLKENF